MICLGDGADDTQVDCAGTLLSNLLRYKSSRDRHSEAAALWCMYPTLAL